MVITRNHAKVISRISLAEVKLLKVSDQLNILMLKLNELRRRRDLAIRDNQRNFIYSITIRMAVIDGVANVLSEYIRNIADEIRELRWLSLQQAVVFVGTDDSETDEEVMEIAV